MMKMRSECSAGISREMRLRLKESQEEKLQYDKGEQRADQQYFP